jgi:GntR family transcriptional repressor for pyruvate dehydrogenase complex
VSRGSIRDAFRTLETIGLLVTRHGQGTFPRELDVERLVAPLASVLSYRHDLQDELMDVRRMFEPAVARVAAARVTDADLAALDRILDVQRKKLKTGRPPSPRTRRFTNSWRAPPATASSSTSWRRSTICSSSRGSSR